MRARLRDIANSDPEKRFWADAITCKTAFFRIEPRDSKGTQRAIIEMLRQLDVANSDGNVVQHVRSSG
jgi:hypothetical protein